MYKRSVVTEFNLSTRNNCCQKQLSPQEEQENVLLCQMWGHSLETDLGYPKCHVQMWLQFYEIFIGK